MLIELLPACDKQLLLLLFQARLSTVNTSPQIIVFFFLKQNKNMLSI